MPRKTIPRALCLCRRFRRDERGAAAVEFAIAFPFLLALLLPITDIAVVAFRFISAHQEMRSLAVYALYNPPSDVTDTASWAAQVATKIPGYTTPPKVHCGTDATNPCASETDQPRWFSFLTQVSFEPIVLSICPTTTPCILRYRERFP